MIATNPAIAPLPAMPMSIVPVFSFTVITANSTPAAAAMLVITRISGNRPSSAPSVDPGLNPNQPSHRISTPSPNSGMLCPGIARGLPSDPYLPLRAPSSSRAASAPVAPIRWTAVEPAKSCMPQVCQSSTPRILHRSPVWRKPPPNTQWAPSG